MSKDLRFNIIVKENFNRAMSVGRSALNGFVGFVGGISRRLRGMLNLRNILIGGGAIAGLTRLAKAYGEQEAVDRRLAAAFGVTGQAADAVIKKWGDFATSLQRVTTLGDEEIMMMIALGKTMGIADEQMENATKGAIGLSKAFGMDLNTAMKGVALAMQGEFSMLQRYIPALRTANSESEKMAILQKAMANGFNIAKAELGTINGMWASFKGVIGDALQSAGKGLFGGGGLIDGIRKLKERMIELTESGAIEKWATRGAEAAKALGDILGDIFSGDQAERAKALGDMGTVVKAMFHDAGTVFMSVVGPALEALFNKLPGVKGAREVGEGFSAWRDQRRIRREVNRDMSLEHGTWWRTSAENREEADRRINQRVGDAWNERTGAGAQLQLGPTLSRLFEERAAKPVWEKVSWTAGEGMEAETPAMAASGDAASAIPEKAIAAGLLSVGEVYTRMQERGAGEDLQKRSTEYLARITKALETEAGS